MKIKTFVSYHSKSSVIDEKINEFIADKKVITITCGVSSGTVLGGGGIVHTVLYEDEK